MIWPPPPSTLLLLVAALVSASVVLYAYQRRSTTGAWQLILLMLAVTVWTIGYALEIISVSLGAKLFWTGIEYLGIAPLATLWLLFVFAYIGHTRLLAGWRIALWFVFPALTLILNWTNSFHHLYYQQVAIDQHGAFPMLITTPGPWYWANVLYSYLAILIGMVLLWDTYRHTAQVYRRQVGVFLSGACVPWLASLLYMSGLNPLAPLDITPFAFVATGLLLAWGLFRYRLLILVPMARDRVLEQLGDAVVVLDADNLIIDLNQAAQRLFSDVDISAFGQPATTVLAEWPTLLDAIRHQGEARLELVWSRPPQRIFEVKVNPLYDQIGRISGQLLIWNDITEHKRTEAALRQSELQFHSLFNHMIEGVALHRVVYDDQGQVINYEILDVNPQYERILNLRREDVCHQLADKVYGTPTPPYLAEFAAVGTSGQPAQFEIYFTPMQKHFSISVSPLAPGYFATIFIDITARKQAEVEQARLQAQLLQSQKMEAIGHLAGGIAHDFNNILTVISGNADLAMSMLPVNHPIYEDLNAIQHSVTRAVRLVRQLLAFARRQVSQPEIVDLNDLVQNITPMLNRLIGEHIHLTFLPEPALHRVKIDPHQFEQVVVNLIVNARDAMSKGGVMTIATANIDITAADTRRYVEAEPGPHVRLIVSDTGDGMTDEVKAHIFEPYFSTKDVGQGTGLGLATCLGIVKQHHGFMWVESTPGQGSQFNVYLPCTDEAPRPLERPESATELKRGTETVLVVEDEPDVRQLAARILGDNGYKVIEACNGQEAQQIAETLAGQEIHLLLTDLIMPLLGGVDLAQQLQARRPQMKILCMSGYAEHLSRLNENMTVELPILHKPFSQATLLQAVRRAIDTAAA